MTHYLTSIQARSLSVSNLIIYNEIDRITRAIYTASLAGNLSAVVDDGTIMTDSTPTITVTSSGAGAFTPGATATFAGTTVTFGGGSTDGTGIDQAVADINAANIVGLSAAVSGSEIVLTFNPLQTAWSLALGAGSGALAELGFTAGTVSASDPESVNYHAVWSGATPDRKKSYEFGQVINHFLDLGYNIMLKKNINTAKPLFKWEIYW